MLQKTINMVNCISSWILNSRNSALAGLLIFFIAFLVRLTGLIIIPETNISTNAQSLLEGADMIRNGQFLGNPDFPLQLPPMASMFVAVMQSFFGEGLFYIKLAQVILDACTVALLFRIGMILLPGCSAILGGGILCFYPFSIFTSLYIGSEVLFTFFLILSIYLSLKSIKNEKLLTLFLAGLLLGFATLTRGTTQYFPVAFVAYIIFYYRRIDGRVLAKCLIYLFGFALVIAPWAARNVIVHDVLVATSTPGLPLLNGSSEEFWVIKDRNQEFPKYFKYLHDEKGVEAKKHPSWIEKDEFYKLAAIEKYKGRWQEDPYSFAPFLIKKLARLWYATETGNNHFVTLAINAPIYLMALYGMWLLYLLKNRSAYLLGWLVAYFVVVHVAVYTLFRFIIPIMPYIILFAAYGLNDFLRRIVISSRALATVSNERVK